MRLLTMLQRDMTNISKSPFTDEIEQIDPPRGFPMPHFTPYKGDESQHRHLKHYSSTMILYKNNDYSSNRLIKRTSDHIFSIVKDPWETIRNYVKRFKVEKAKIVGYNEDIATTAFRNGLPTEHSLFGKLIMGEELTLATSYALAEKHTLWDKAKQSNKNESEKKRMECSPTIEDSVPETFTKFTVPISQILCKLKNEPLFELPPPMMGDLIRMCYTKNCAFHQGPGHITNGSLKWKQYLEKLTNKSCLWIYAFVDFCYDNEGIQRIEANRSETRSTKELAVRIGDQEVAKSDCFRYLESILKKNGDLDGNLNHRIQAGWTKWKSASSVV
ncbi:uncharacterized protein [Malus domestica]|uniref:uncharacterized protein n=1 Tax=Malus domestica TaxID=3750 RepID=UPI0039765DB2